MSETDTNQQNDTKNLPAEPAGPVQEASGIPKFDLAEQILAEQRKVTAIKRKAPDKPQGLAQAPATPVARRGCGSEDGAAGKNSESTEKQPGVESAGYTIKQAPAVLSEREQIIAEIVARDIEGLLRGR